MVDDLVILHRCVSKTEITEWLKCYDKQISGKGERGQTGEGRMRDKETIELSCGDTQIVA